MSLQHELSLREHFNEGHAKGFDGSGDLRFVFYSNATIRWARKELPELAPRNILDLGAGDVWLLQELGKMTPSSPLLIAIDISDTSRQKCAARIASSGHQRTYFVQADACNTPLKDGSIDFLTSTMLMEHLDDHRFLSEVHRLLSKKGVALITTVIKKPWGWYYLKNSEGKSVLELSHLREYSSLTELTQLFEKHGFRILQSNAAQIRFTLLTPLFKRLSNPWMSRFPATKAGVLLRLLTRVPIPGYLSAEIIATKSS